MRSIFKRYQSAGTLALVAVLTVAIGLVAALAPLRSSAADKPQVFRPERFVAVPVPAHDQKHEVVKPKPDYNPQQRLEEVLGKPDQLVEPKRLEVASLAEAERELHTSIRKPSSLPSGFGGEPRITLFTAGSATYTIDLARLHDQFAKAGFGDVQLPPSLHGAQVSLDIPAMVVLAYGPGDRPLIVAQGRAPTLTMSAGVDVAALRQVLLNYPRVPAEYRETLAALRAIAEWQTTVPVPVGPNEQARAVGVDGADGLLVRSARQGEAGVVWSRRGSVYAVGGPLSDDGLLAVANSLR